MPAARFSVRSHTLCHGIRRMCKTSRRLIHLRPYHGILPTSSGPCLASTALDSSKTLIFDGNFPNVLVNFREYYYLNLSVIFNWPESRILLWSSNNNSRSSVLQRDSRSMIGSSSAQARIFEDYGNLSSASRPYLSFWTWSHN